MSSETPIGRDNREPLGRFPEGWMRLGRMEKGRNLIATSHDGVVEIRPNSSGFPKATRSQPSRPGKALARRNQNGQTHSIALQTISGSTSLILTVGPIHF